MVRLMPRLLAIAGLVPEGGILADIGSDHGFLPIHAIRSERVPRAIAIERTISPYRRLLSNVQAAGLASCIDVRLGNGFTPLARGEAETVVLAGMGGDTIRSILEAGEDKPRSALLLLQPNDGWGRLRRWLLTQGFALLPGDMVREGRVFYQVIAAVADPVGYPGAVRDMEEVSRAFAENGCVDLPLDIMLQAGPDLFRQRHPVLAAYASREAARLAGVRWELNKRGVQGTRPEQVGREQEAWERVMTCLSRSR